MKGVHECCLGCIGSLLEGLDPDGEAAAYKVSGIGEEEGVTEGCLRGGGGGGSMGTSEEPEERGRWDEVMTHNPYLPTVPILTKSKSKK